MHSDHESEIPRPPEVTVAPGAPPRDLGDSPSPPTPLPNGARGEGADVAHPIVVFDGVSKWYGNVIGINKLTLRIPPGVTGLLGPNGAGKSTLLQLATGQLRPSQGEVRVPGPVGW